MIVFDLHCDSGHRFEGWFGSSGNFAEQQQAGLVTCPHCGSHTVIKAPMAPAVPRKGADREHPPRAVVRSDIPRQAGDETRGVVASDSLPAGVGKALAQLAQAQHEALKTSRWVGESFAETSRAMHYGERKEEPIHGKASAKEARSLVEEGIKVAPLPFPIAPPDEVH